MAVHGIHEEILQGRTGRVLHAINSAEAVLGRQQIDFPRIAVFGDESTGKSSMLEAICKIPFPRGNKTTTRCPTILHLQRKPQVKWSATAWAGFEKGERLNVIRVAEPARLTEAIASLQNKVLEGVERFSEIPVNVAIESPDTVDLMLVDLPGYFTHEALASSSDGFASIIKQSLLTFLQDMNTIALVVVPANQLVKTVNIFNLLKEYSKSLPSEEMRKHFQARTIYCFTKCDLVAGDPGTQHGASYDIEEILRNKGSFAAEPHGWYAVVNDKGEPTANNDFMGRLAADRDEEEKFFDRTSPYNKPDLRPRCGTGNLLGKLASMLEQKIAEKVPTMSAQTEIALSQAMRELKQYGTPPPEDRNVNVECRTIIDDIRAYYVNATEGIYGELNDEVEDLAEDFTEEDLEKCELGHKRSVECQAFADAIKASRLPLDDPKYREKLRLIVEKAANGKLEYTMPIPEVAFEEARRCAKKWRDLGAGLCNQIADSAIECLSVLVQVKASKYQNLPSWLNEHFRNMIEEQRAKAHTRLEWHYVDEVMRPDTLNEFFKKEIDSIKNLPGLGKNKDGNRDAYVAILKAYLPIAEARYIDNAVRTVTTHIFDVPSGKRRSRVPSDVPPKYTFQVLEIQEVEDMDDLMKIRDDLAGKREEQAIKVAVLEELRDALRAIPTVSSLIPGGISHHSAEKANGYGSGAMSSAASQPDDEIFEPANITARPLHAMDSRPGGNFDDFYADSQSVGTFIDPYAPSQANSHQDVQTHSAFSEDPAAMLQRMTNLGPEVRRGDRRRRGGFQG
eukprot:GFKZ01002005.1.p1 GENE.GFKZ01002005.1~~GFKZ01002005.1.p1  ORF type:complete len:874 (-),score=133.92 GFKZ01002005.1:4095-6470(-)